MSGITNKIEGFFNGIKEAGYILFVEPISYFKHGFNGEIRHLNKDIDLNAFYRKNLQDKIATHFDRKLFPYNKISRQQVRQMIMDYVTRIPSEKVPLHVMQFDKKGYEHAINISIENNLASLDLALDNPFLNTKEKKSLKNRIEQRAIEIYNESKVPASRSLNYRLVV